jgi:gliding motility-associated-like protein
MNTGKGFNPETTTTDTVFTIRLRDIMYEISGGEVCFFINATATNNPHGISGQSKSSSICASHTEAVTVPNLFTPNNDLRNDRFRPVLSFTPSVYHLIISNRQGKVLFETRDFNVEWDGSGDGSGEGVYLWFLRITAPSGKTISRTGTVTVIK